MAALPAETVRFWTLASDRNYAENKENCETTLERVLISEPQQRGSDLEQNEWLSVLRLFTGVGSGVSGGGAPPPRAGALGAQPRRRWSSRRLISYAVTAAYYHYNQQQTSDVGGQRLWVRPVWRAIKKEMNDSSRLTSPSETADAVFGEFWTLLPSRSTGD